MEQREVLIGIAAVAAVVWTGALIARQIKLASTQRELEVEFGDVSDANPVKDVVVFDGAYTATLDYLQMSFMLALVGTFIVGRALQILMVILLVAYLWLCWRLWTIGTESDRDQQMLPALAPTMAGFKRERLVHAYLNFVALYAYIVILFSPTSETIEWVTVSLLFFGLQFVSWYQFKRSTPVPNLLRRLRQQLAGLRQKMQ